MISGGVNLVMTVIGFAVSTMFIVFVCTRLVCARIQLNASRRSFPVASRSDLSIVSIFSYLFLSSVVPCLVTAKAWDCRMENIVLNILFPNNWHHLYRAYFFFQVFLAAKQRIMFHFFPSVIKTEDNVTIVPLALFYLLIPSFLLLLLMCFGICLTKI